MIKVFISKIENELELKIKEGLSFINWEEILKPNCKVFIKPNLTFPKPIEGVTTTPIFTETVVKILKERTDNIILGESDGGYNGWPAEVAFKNHYFYEISRKYDIKLINLSKSPTETVEINTSNKILLFNLPSILLNDIDLLISLPVPKIHQVTLFTGAIKNQWGCIPDTMRLKYHPYFDEAILNINKKVKTKLIIVDGSYFLNRNGPMYGDPIFMDLLIVSNSMVATDLTLSKIMGLNIDKIKYLELASKNLVDNCNVEYNSNLENFIFNRFYLKRSLRNKIVAFAFKRSWAIKLFWDSWFAKILHKIFYYFSGNPVKEAYK